MNEFWNIGTMINIKMIIKTNISIYMNIIIFIYLYVYNRYICYLQHCKRICRNVSSQCITRWKIGYLETAPQSSQTSSRAEKTTTIWCTTLKELYLSLNVCSITSTRQAYLQCSNTLLFRYRQKYVAYRLLESSCWSLSAHVCHATTNSNKTRN